MEKQFWLALATPCICLSFRGTIPGQEPQSLASFSLRKLLTQGYQAAMPSGIGQSCFERKFSEIAPIDVTHHHTLRPYPAMHRGITLTVIEVEFPPGCLFTI